MKVPIAFTGATSTNPLLVPLVAPPKSRFLPNATTKVVPQKVVTEPKPDTVPWV